MTDNDDPAFDLNTLMSLDPLSLSSQDLDRIIAYQRKQRASREAGVKTKKDPGGNAVDIKALLGQIGKPKAEAKPAVAELFKKGEAAPTPKTTGFIRRF